MQVISITLTISLLTWLFVTSAVVALAPWVPVLHSVPRPHMHMLASLAGTLMIARSPATAVSLSLCMQHFWSSRPRGGRTQYTRLCINGAAGFEAPHAHAGQPGEHTHDAQISSHSCEQSGQSAEPAHCGSRPFCHALQSLLLTCGTNAAAVQHCKC